jgi:hypothetical protein
MQPKGSWSRSCKPVIRGKKPRRWQAGTPCQTARIRATMAQRLLPSRSRHTQSYCAAGPPEPLRHRGEHQSPECDACCAWTGKPHHASAGKKPEANLDIEPQWLTGAGGLLTSRGCSRNRFTSQHGGCPGTPLPSLPSNALAHAAFPWCCRIASHLGFAWLQWGCFGCARLSESVRTDMLTSSGFFPNWPMQVERRPSPRPLRNGQPASSNQAPMRNQQLTARRVSMLTAIARPCAQSSSFHADSSAAPAKSLGAVPWCCYTMNRGILCRCLPIVGIST